jgi:hypothetical protein
MPIAVREGAHNVRLRTRCDEDAEIGRKIRNALGQCVKKGLRDDSFSALIQSIDNTRIGPTVVSAIRGLQDMNFLNCSVAELVVRRERFPLTILSRDIFQWWSTSANV